MIYNIVAKWGGGAFTTGGVLAIIPFSRRARYLMSNVGVLDYSISPSTAATSVSLVRLYLPFGCTPHPVIRNFVLNCLPQYMRLVSNQNLSSIPWTVVLHGPIEGEAFPCGFAEAAPRQRLRLLALGVTSLPPRRPKSARGCIISWPASPHNNLPVQFFTTVSFAEPYL